MESESATKPCNHISRLRFRRLLRTGDARDVRFCPVLSAFASAYTENAKRTQRRKIGCNARTTNKLQNVGYSGCRKMSVSATSDARKCKSNPTAAGL